ncbi:MAG: hypothetical protein ACE5JL_15810 [Dehalococcoidia bacterium]
MWRRAVSVGLVLVLGLVVGGFSKEIGRHSRPQEEFAGERIVLLRLMPSGRVVEINPSTRHVFMDLDRYLDRTLDGKRVLEIKLQGPSTGCDQIMLIRYEE